jgi:hypothetical protein
MTEREELVFRSGKPRWKGISMNTMKAIKGVALMGATVTPHFFTRKNHDEENSATAGPAACCGSDHQGAVTRVSRRGMPAWRQPLVRLSLMAAFAACLTLTCASALAQEVIHALPGTVASIDTAGKKISIKLDDGSVQIFKEIYGSNAASRLEKTLQAKAIPISGFGKPGEHVILFYYGMGDLCTAVAYKDSGTTPAKQMSGVVSQFEKKQHLLTVVGAASQKKQISLPEQTVVDTPDGVIDGLQFHPSKGDHLEVLWSQGSGQPTALFISES